MGLPGQRRSKASKRRRAAHFALKRQQLTACAKCKKMILPHAACPHCGTYRGRVVLVTAAMKRLKRLQRRQRKAKTAEKG
ncbi:50S ribosomal protein L32 [Candidatus Uhrbacteria bacterium RIFCSPLOWO2_02_FULL_48_12]|uniref:Large ribosomal subunit protein bL32 n=1 Tax=Candidatus Uhrbacteria bacterium RIFCSPLOWO2_02_FULL_48_12 TaxID=1802407 RepID=A0A1F7V839_9BACT|nr:MAG: 50S ribosomal protein L32 [Candidatus Uhrbacteria bacterium RIFCSPLOWO2_02_FULL_48_12]